MPVEVAGRGCRPRLPAAVPVEVAGRSCWPPWPATVAGHGLAGDEPRRLPLPQSTCPLRSVYECATINHIGYTVQNLSRRRFFEQNAWASGHLEAWHLGAWALGHLDVRTIGHLNA